MTDKLNRDVFSDKDSSQANITRSWIYKSWIYLLCVLIGIFASGTIIYSLESNFADQRQVNNAIDALDNDVKAVLINTINMRNTGYSVDDSGAIVKGSQIDHNCKLKFNFMHYSIVIDGSRWAVTDTKTGETISGSVEQINSEEDII